MIVIFMKGRIKCRSLYLLDNFLLCVYVVHLLFVLKILKTSLFPEKLVTFEVFGFIT